MNFPLGVLFVDRRPLKIIRTSVKNLLKLFFFMVYNTYSFLFLSKHLNKYLAKKLIMTETSEAIQIGELEFWEMYKPVFSKLKTPARPYKLLIFQQEVINQALQFLTKRKYNPRLFQIAIRSTAKIMDLSSDEEKEMGAILHDLGKREFQYQEASKYVLLMRQAVQRLKQQKNEYVEKRGGIKEMEEMSHHHFQVGYRTGLDLIKQDSTQGEYNQHANMMIYHMQVPPYR